MWGMLLLMSSALGENFSEQAAWKFMNNLSDELSKKANQEARNEWEYMLNSSRPFQDKKLKYTMEIASWRKEMWHETQKYPWQTYQNETLKRMFQLSLVIGQAALPDHKLKQFEKLITQMEMEYSKATLPNYRNKAVHNITVHPELQEIFRSSRDPEELKYYWEEWRKASGRKLKQRFVEYVQLANEAARCNNFSNAADLWNYDYEMEDIDKEILELWKQVEPLYLEMHAYVRRKLNEKYGDKIVSRTGPIPAHLLGDIWAQTWNNIYDFCAPYSHKESIDVTDEMKRQGYTIEKMIKLAEDFYTSINMSAMTEDFWNNSQFIKSNGSQMHCTAAAWDFFDGQNYRFSMCAEVTMADLLTAHHEMGHIEYYMQYKDLNFFFRQGANQGFQEAVGDAIYLSASSNKNLHRIGLLSEESVGDSEQMLNGLFLKALQKIAFLPFALVVDVFRWKIFRGEITPEHYNSAWWHLREKYQGLEPPVDRYEDDFDAGSKFHVIRGIPYMRYFVSHILEFQFHRALCIEAGEFEPAYPDANPLHECNIFGSSKAGNLFKNMLSMGCSKPWSDAMYALTGQGKMDGTALVHFFNPLYQWLKEENKKTGEKIGWDHTNRNVHPGSDPTSTSTMFYVSRILIIHSVLSMYFIHVIF